MDVVDFLRIFLTGKVLMFWFFWDWINILPDCLVLLEDNIPNISDEKLIEIW